MNNTTIGQIKIFVTKGLEKDTFSVNVVHYPNNEKILTFNCSDELQINETVENIMTNILPIIRDKIHDLCERANEKNSVHTTLAC